MLFATEKEMLQFYQKTTKKIAELLANLNEIEYDEEVNYKTLQEGKAKIKDVKIMLNNILTSHKSNSQKLRDSKK